MTQALTYGRERTPNSERVSRFGRVSFELVPQLNHRLFPPSHCGTEEAWKGWRPFPFPRTRNGNFILFAEQPRRPRPRRRRHRRARADQHRQDPSRDRADARRIRRGMIGLPLRLLAREVYNKVRRPGRRRERRADHRRGEDQAAEPALLGLDRRGDAARSRRRLRRHRRGPARRRSRARPCLHRPHAQPARPRGDAGARRRDRAADGRAAAAGRACADAPAALAAHLRRREEDRPACRAAPPSSRSRPRRSTRSPN